MTRRRRALAGLGPAVVSRSKLPAAIGRQRLLGEDFSRQANAGPHLQPVVVMRHVAASARSTTGRGHTTAITFLPVTFVGVRASAYSTVRIVRQHGFECGARRNHVPANGRRGIGNRGASRAPVPPSRGCVHRRERDGHAASPRRWGARPDLCRQTDGPPANAQGARPARADCAVDRYSTRAMAPGRTRVRVSAGRVREAPDFGTQQDYRNELDTLIFSWS